MRRMDPVAGAAMKDDGELRGRCAHYIAQLIASVIHDPDTSSNVDAAA